MTADPIPPTSSPAAGRRIALGCIALFTLPFLLVGLFVLGEAFRELHRLPLPQTLPLFLVGTLFVCVPALIALVVRVGLREATQAMGARKAYPGEPWRWRADWMRGEARDQFAPRAAGMIVFAILWNGIAAVFTVGILRAFTAGNRVALVGLLFPVIGVALLVFALYQAMRQHKYGVSVCRMGALPIEPGKPFHAEIDMHVADAPEDGFVVTLECVQRTTRRGSRAASYDDVVLWRDERRESAASATRYETGQRLPVSFAIPADAQPTGDVSFSTRILWRLRVTAEVPGVDYAAEFELPVFRR